MSHMADSVILINWSPDLGSTDPKSLVGRLWDIESDKLRQLHVSEAQNEQMKLQPYSANSSRGTATVPKLTKNICRRYI
jgi:hypothetical protein